jgi:hypothetical protein
MWIRRRQPKHTPNKRQAHTEHTHAPTAIPRAVFLLASPSGFKKGALLGEAFGAVAKALRGAWVGGFSALVPVRLICGA